MSTIGQAIAALRGGRAVRIGAGPPLTILAVETATPEMLAMLDPGETAPLLISGHRAAALSLANRRDSAAPAAPVLLTRADWLDGPAARALADAGQDYARAPIGPLNPLPLEDALACRAALGLARAAGLLPALWLVEDGAGGAAIDSADIFAAKPTMTLAARSDLPIDGLPKSQILAFRASDDGQEHIALVIGAFAGEPPLVRLHSECLTGDVFGSLKCDCGPQLHEALRIIGDSGGGVLLYLRQEGRGIGLANKLRAYALQDRGLDTVDANLRLGFADDERDYAHAAAILNQLKVDRVRLLTNNPAKVTGLEAHGIAVAERIAHHMPANPHNADYLAVKRARSGHLA
ncbi:MAG: GTP cyclohydrolase II [Sphingomicrobium sp.]